MSFAYHMNLLFSDTQQKHIRVEFSQELQLP